MEHFTKGLYDSSFEHDSCGVGFVANIKGERSHSIVEMALGVLNRLSHRGAVGADPNTGDGAGILIQIPHEFYKKECEKEGIDLPERENYATGIIFLPQNEKESAECKNYFKKFAKQEDLEILGWRKVQIDDSDIGITAKKTQPLIEQVFIGKPNDIKDIFSFRRKLYLLRKQVENAVASSVLKQKGYFYITDISPRTVIYKGLLMPKQVGTFYPEINDPLIKSAIALIHSRYSTNTFPTWDLAQPFRFLAHNGEINTLRGNINWMTAREGNLKSEYFGEDFEKLKPIIRPGGSDSAALDNVFELLFLNGMSMPHSMLMLIPQAWENDKYARKQLKDFFQYHACIMEPWDGPAAIAFTDGKRIGAVLDRNGLRPARYIVTKDGLVVMASEMGVIDIEPADISISGRIEPGKMMFIDTEKGRIMSDEDIKDHVSAKNPYGEWLKANIIELDDLPKTSAQEGEHEDIYRALKQFGYSREDMRTIIKPMAEKGKEPIGSMGDDTPHAVLSKQPQRLFNYFRQLFAQVTNPAIDPIREEIVMSLESYIGAQGNLLEQDPKHSKKIRVKEPVLRSQDYEKLRTLNKKEFKAKVFSTLADLKKKENFKSAVKRLQKETEDAINKGYVNLILSDRGFGPDKCPLPSLLAVSAVHQYLVKKGLRTQCSIIVDSGEPREVNHFALLFSFGADLVHPYLAFEAIDLLETEGEIFIDSRTGVENYIHAINAGLLKILSKMGISTLRSYRGAQTFEALGLGEKFINDYFFGTTTRIGGAEIEDIERDYLRVHEVAHSLTPYPDILPSGGVYQWKKDGEKHLWNPDTIALLQDSVRKEDFSKFKEFSYFINEQKDSPVTLRSLFRFKKGKPVNINEVESAEKILKRFATGAMSFGSISKEAHEKIAIAMNRLGAKSNTGEGGEDPKRFKPLPNGDLKRSAIKQVASGRFGVTANYLINADEIQIKIAQGAKPGEGGQLPGHKVSEMIAKTRYTTPGVTLISPPPHHDIYSIEDLAQLIFDLKNVNPAARISVKLVSEVGVGTVAAGVAKGHADMILISGGDGGTGASPLSSIKYAGLPWELGLSETHQTLVLNDLRSRVRLQTDGQMRTGKDVAVAALLGAEEFGFCSAVLVVLGCVMLRHCHLNNCSVGVATQNDLLSKRFSGKPEYVVTYLRFVVEELREIMAQLGFRTVDEMVGRTDKIETDLSLVPEKAKKLDLSKILYRPDGRVICSISQDHGIDKVLDRKLINLSEPALKGEGRVKVEIRISNTDRATGAMLSGELVKRKGEAGLADDSIQIKFKGTAGQSFGAFLAKGITFELEGMANDYVGKGLSGGKLIIYPDKESTYNFGQNIIIGNTTFYGAISGEAYINGIAGERFCIRNSGIKAVVEGVGDHGCEYMTGGTVVVIGKTGRNFGAGMSGGIAYVYDKDREFEDKCNHGMIELEELNKEDMAAVKSMLEKHHAYTGSPAAKKILDSFNKEIRKFVKVIPTEYKRVLLNKKFSKKQLEETEM